MPQRVCLPLEFYLPSRLRKTNVAPLSPNAAAMLFNSYDFVFLFVPISFALFLISNALRPSLNGIVVRGAKVRAGSAAK